MVGRTNPTCTTMTCVVGTEVEVETEDDGDIRSPDHDGLTSPPRRTWAVRYGAVANLMDIYV